jgi:cation diffusion facilitator CzcD-associated flavoprotein CzcO
MFRDRDVLVIGAGCSGMEIAADLADGGAATIHLSIRTPPNILLRSIAGLPGDPAAMLLLRLPPRTADTWLAPMRRLTIGDLAAYGLPVPTEGPFQRLARTGDGPAVVDRDVLHHIRSGRIHVVAEVTALDNAGAYLADGRHITADAIIAATGYRTGLSPLVGHLDVLDDHGRPTVSGGAQAAPGLWFIGFHPQPGQLGALGAEARRVAAGIARDSHPPTGGHHGRPEARGMPSDLWPDSDGDFVRFGCCRSGVDVVGVERLRGGLAAFTADLFASLTRSGWLRRAAWYLQGLMLDGPRKPIQPMAARLGGVREQALNHCVTNSPWPVSRYAPTSPS